jgi:glycosyltransferase involved in cell wall biosynthesis
MSSEAKISAVIITFNEEQYIEQCLDSLTGVVDEIVVIDSFSTDRTPQLCEKRKVEFHQLEWEGYAKTKNRGNSLAKHEIILSIDADELLSKELQESIMKIKGSGDSGFSLENTYSFNRLNNYCGKWIKNAGWYPDTKVRIFPKRRARWEGEVHEKLVVSEGISNRFIEGDLLHYSIASLQDHMDRERKYAALAKKYPNAVAAFFAAAFKFFKMYVLRLGFLDGKLGFQLCFISARAKLWR